MNWELLNITEGFDNIQYPSTPAFIHFWIDGNDGFQSKPGEVLVRKFRGRKNLRETLLKYLEKEHADGKTVYIFGEPQIMYDPHNFEPVYVFRINSYDGTIRKVKEIEEPPMIENNTKNYKYLLIA